MRFVVLALFYLLPPIGARAQDAYPARTINMIVPFPPGGTTDVVARIVADKLREVLGQTVIVDNRAGAGGAIGTAAIVKAAPDGYTIGMATASTVAINPVMNPNLAFDVLTDLAAVSNIAAVPNVMSVHPSVPASSMAEFIKLAQAQPGKMSYGSAGNGSVSHLLGEQFKLNSKTDLVHIPYRGAGPALNDAVGGQIQAVFDNIPTSLPLIQDNKLRALAVSGPKRLAALPDVPTFTELGLPDCAWMAFFGIVTPAKTPPAIVQRLHAAIVKISEMPDIRDKLAQQQAQIVASSPEQFADEIKRELDRNRRAVAAANIKLN